jgi:phosphomannomutase
MLKTKMKFSGSIESIIDNLINEFSDGKPLKEDGIKISFQDKWVQLRASNTEPFVRVIAEAKAKEEAQNLIDRALNYIENK